jgi:hypothetical protein
MVKEMLLGALNALVAALFVTLNSAAPQLRALTFDTDEPDTCIENNRHFINHVSGNRMSRNVANQLNDLVLELKLGANTYMYLYLNSNGNLLHFLNKKFYT